MKARAAARQRAPQQFERVHEERPRTAALLRHGRHVYGAFAREDIPVSAMAAPGRTLTRNLRPQSAGQDEENPAGALSGFTMRAPPLLRGSKPKAKSFR
jgi:hypothetical protein